MRGITKTVREGKESKREIGGEEGKTNVEWAKTCRVRVVGD